MKKYLQFSFILFLIISSISIFFSCGTKTVEGDVALIHVNVTPMDKEQILLDQTVVLKDGFIIDLGLSSSINVSSNTTQIDASRQYLIPALSDMHVHIEGDAWNLIFPKEAQYSKEQLDFSKLLFLYIAIG